MSKSSAAEERVHGLVASKLDVVAIRDALARYGVWSQPEAPIADLVALLQQQFAEVDDSSLADCNGCLGASPLDLDVCPFCGVGGEVNGMVATDPEPDEVAESDDARPEEGAISDSRSVDVGPQVLEQAQAPVEPEEQKMTQVKGKGAKAKKSAALASVTPIHDGVLEDKLAKLAPLDKFVAEVKQIQNVAHVSSYMLAKKLAEGEINGVWKTKLNAKQKPEYGNFETFAEIELGMSGKYVRQLLKLYANFTEQQFKEIPPTKLRLVLEVAPDARPNLLEKIKGGASRREIERSIGRGNHDSQGAKGKQAAPRPAISTSGNVTIAIVEKKVRFPFFAELKKKGDPERPAKKIGDKPWGRIPLTINDVETLITITVNPRGELFGTVEQRRVDPTK